MLSLQNSFFAVKPTDIPIGKGKLLVAAPGMTDGYFERTVVLLLEQDAEGSMGLILNRPLHVHLRDVLSGLSGCPHRLHNGGPVGLNQLFFLHQYEQLAEDSTPVAEGIYFGGSEAEVRSLLQVNLLEEERIRFFVGYAGWSAGQLEEELSQQAWVVADMRREYLNAPCSRLWRNVVHTLGEGYGSWLEIPDKAFYN